MAKLVFRYATMKSGKSAEAIQIINNYLYVGKIGVVLTPSVDTETSGTIKTRFGGGVEVKAKTFTTRTNLYKYIQQLLKEQLINFIVVDEANFLTTIQVEQLGQIVDELNIDILAYGLLTNFNGVLFDGAKRLVEISDKIEQITVKSICKCGNSAIFNARYINGKFMNSGKEIVIDRKDGIDSNIEYVPLCRKCYSKHSKKEQ